MWQFVTNPVHQDPTLRHFLQRVHVTSRMLPVCRRHWRSRVQGCAEVPWVWQQFSCKLGWQMLSRLWLQQLLCLPLPQRKLQLMR